MAHDSLHMRMGRLVQIRDVPEDVHRTLKARAAMSGVSLSEYLRSELARMAARPPVDELIARYDWRRRFPELRETLDWVQDLRKWFNRQYEKPAREALLKLIERATQSAQESLARIAGTLTRWFEPMVRFIRHRHTNGITEGFNNKIKLIQRMAYGLRHEHLPIRPITSSFPEFQADGREQSPTRAVVGCPPVPLTRV